MYAETNSSSSTGRRAVVVGGSMAGLLAGRVLADHFERVTIVERYRFPEGPVPRKGVPQARHVHALLKRGRITVERLSPVWRTSRAPPELRWNPALDPRRVSDSK